MKFQAIRDLRNNISGIDLDTITEKALKARGDDIAELNRDQLRRGERVDGSILPSYSQKSVTRFGKPAGAIKLFDSGDYYAGIMPKFTNKSFEVIDTDDKTDLLEEKYGTTIGLQQDSINELAQDSLGQIQYELRKQL